ncbi:hypothetical protein BBJ_1608 [Burkholderia pseudomallei NCTC 13178]|nr:hypothetical protein BBJ_1608 [Burkholderia pseudomallei NCTC 13178]
MRRGATHRRVERAGRTATASGRRHRQMPFVREPLRTCERHFVRHRFNAWHAGVRRIRGRRRSSANRCELANGIRPPRCNACRAGVRRIRGRRRSCASRCELANGISSATASTLGTPAFAAYAADAVPARTAANLRTAFGRQRCNVCRTGVRRIRAPSRGRPRNRTRDRPRPAPSPASSSRTVTFLLPPALGSRHITTRVTFDAHDDDDEVRRKRAAPLYTI